MIESVKKWLLALIDFCLQRSAFLRNLICHPALAKTRLFLNRILAPDHAEPLYATTVREQPQENLRLSFIVYANDACSAFRDLIRGFEHQTVTSELLIVSNRPQQSDDSRSFPTAAEAVLHATGHYLCFIGPDERWESPSLEYAVKAITEMDADLFFGNFLYADGELERVYQPEFGYDFSWAALPVNMLYGPKIVSKSLAIRNRLPRGEFLSIYDYFLELSERTRKVCFFDRPVVTVAKSKTSLANDHLLLVAQQKKALNRRMFYCSRVQRPEQIRNILFIVPYLVVGGAEAVLFGLTKHFVAQGLNVDIFCTHCGGEWLDRFTTAGAKVYVSEKHQIHEKFEEMSQLTARNDYDVVHCSNTEYGDMFLPHLYSLKKVPLIFNTVHSHMNPLIEYTKFYQSYLDSVIFVNNVAREKSGRDFCNKDQLTTVHNGIDLPEGSLPAPDARFANVVITFLGRISEEKNPLQFISIAKELNLRHPHWKYEVVGDGPLLPAMKLQAKAAGLANHVCFHGLKHDGLESLKDSSCLVICSLTEGLPIVMLEAMASGVPVVSSNVGGISEVLSSGVNGYLVDDPSDTEAYVRCIEELFCDVHKYQGIAAACLDSSRGFSFDIMGENVLRTYHQALAVGAGKFPGTVAIAMLSFNRLEELKKTVASIFENTELPFKLIILDNNSDTETTDYLRDLSARENNVEVIFESSNLGCPKGRRKMLDRIKADYIVTIDNDMELPPFWLRDLILRLEEDPRIMGVCVKDIFPSGRVEFTGGTIEVDKDGFTFFCATKYNLNYDDLSTLEEFDCLWLPGGATLWRGSIKEIAEHASEYVNAFEDFDYSLQVRSKGYRIVNCPNVMFIHNHASTYDSDKKEKEARYLKDRNNAEGFKTSMAVFYKRTGLVIKNEWLYQVMDIPLDTTPDGVRNILNAYGPDVTPIPNVSNL